MMTDLFDWKPPSSGEEARDEALTQVSENTGEWKDRAMNLISSVPMDTFIGEDIREHIVGKIGNPHSNNAMGALVMNAVRRGIIEPTGEYRKMRRKSSHARESKVYRHK
tara:strand:+ start:9105 stop:9431 length:327 start_codon:yes stop_codon:yes gene_type:complete